MQTSVRLVQLGLALIATTLAAAEPATSVAFRPITFEAAQAAAKAENKIVFIDFFTTWCGPCKQLDRTTWQDPAVARLLAEKAIALKIDAEKEAALAKRYQIEAYPTLLLLKPDGSELGRLIGFRSAEKFLKEFVVEATGANAATEAAQRAAAASDDAAVMARVETARKHAASGEYAKALDDFVWCFDDGMPKSAAYAGARCSFLTNEWGNLAKLYPPARLALVERRDRAAHAAESPAAAPSVISEYAALNDALGEGELNLKMYESLPADSPRRSILRTRLFDRLLAAKRYEEAVQARPFASAASWIDQLAQIKKSQPSPEAVSAFVKGVVPNVASAIEAQVGTGHIEAAETLATKLLALMDTPEVRAQLSSAAARAGRPDLWPATPSATTPASPTPQL